MKKKKDFIKFSIVSFVTTIIDLTLFRIISNNSHRLIIIGLATLISRIVSTILCYVFNKYWVFKSKKQDIKELLQFVILVCTQIVASSILVWLLRFLPIPQLIIKMIVDTTLFFAGYFIQKKYIFKEKEA
jgi:putative flippase GtrA